MSAPERKPNNVSLERNLSPGGRELRESLRYAGLIQQALLPDKKLFEMLVPDHFILFMPKESLSGDFYWIARNNGNICLAVADCTGHGIPGALMSFLGITFLNDIIRNGHTDKANRILNILREKVMNALQQTGKNEEPRDGMDMSLCLINPAERKLQFSGANNPAYIIRNNELIEVKPDKMPVGISATEERSFANREIDLEKDDRLYLFTDGYTDQFGGPRNKKFKYRAFRKLLLEIHAEKMEKQRLILEQNIKEWMGKEEQIDDILITGIHMKPVLK